MKFGKKEGIFIVLLIVLFLLIKIVYAVPPDNNKICSGYPVTCEYANLTACLNGENNTLITASDENIDSAACIINENGDYSIDYTTQYNITAAGGTIYINASNVLLDGNSSWINMTPTGSGAQQIGIIMGSYENITIKNFRFFSVHNGDSGSGMWCLSAVRCKNVHIENNSFYYYEMAIELGAENETIINNYAFNTTHFLNIFNSSLYIFNNNVNGDTNANTSGTIRIGGGSKTASNFNITNNSFGSLRFAGAQNIYLYNNNFSGILSIAGGDYADNVTIISNNIQGGDLFGGPTSILRNLTIVNNKINVLALFNAFAGLYNSTIQNNTINFTGISSGGMDGVTFKWNNINASNSLTINELGGGQVAGGNNFISNTYNLLNYTGTLLTLNYFDNISNNNFTGSVSVFDNRLFYSNNITNSTSYCLRLNSQDSFNSQSDNIVNNTFTNCGNNTGVYSLISNVTNYTISYSPFIYNEVNYDACVRVYDSALAQETITKDNTLVTDPDGVVHYQLWLITDTANALGCSGTKKLTLWIASDYANPCDVIVPAIGGTCDYSNTYAFEAKGNGQNYTWNTSIINSTLYIISGNTSPPYLKYNQYLSYTYPQAQYPILIQGDNNNITGNTFSFGTMNYSVNITGDNNTFWYNNFYSSGINDLGNINTMGCYNNIGNFYDYRVPYTEMASGECGLVNITSPSSQSSSNPITVTWTAQSSYNTITYILEYVLNNVRTRIGTTTLTSYSWTVPKAAGENYTINIIPQGSNGTHRNSTVVVSIEAPPENPSNMPSGGGEAGETTLPGAMTQILENIEGFRTDISEAALNVIVGEIKTQSMQITNPTQYNLIIKVIPDKNLDDIIKPSENYFLLKPDETKTITFDIIAKYPGEYKGVIKLVSDKYQKIIDVNIIAKAGQISDITEPLIIEKSTLRNRIRDLFMWIGNLIILLVNWFKALF